MNKDKFQIGVHEVEYFGHLLSEDEFKQDPFKVVAEMEPLPTVWTTDSHEYD